jgi:tetratricopeptide (TPR) repeat protein
MEFVRMSGLARLFLLAWLLALAFFPTKTSAQTCEPWAGKAVSIQGGIQVLKFGQTAWSLLSLNDHLCYGDTVHVAENSRAAVLLPNEGLLRLDQNTTVKFPEPEIEKSSLIDLIKGVTHFFSRTPRSLKVLTPFVNGNVEGTEFLVKVDEQQTHLLVFKGKINAENNSGSLMVIDGQSIVARAGAAPAYKTVVQPRDTVHWALYYPPITDVQSIAILELDDTAQKNTIRESLAAYKRGDPTTALNVLEALPENLQNSDLLTYRAGLLLAVGRVESAGDDIKKALQLDPAQSDAMAFKTIIAVVQNRKAEALELALKASDLDPSSIAATIALSYAHQASFDIESALEKMQNAVDLAPQNALAWARLSELWLSVNDLKKALEAAETAASLNPSVTRTQTVLGFAYLAQINTKAARTAFETAINLDQTAPLPRLGLGLAVIRDGGLDEGRQHIEIAAGLDPNNALIRSYLGKAFYDEKREKLAGNQWAISKGLDPNDPTPWFYDAILKQTTNRPVEALKDLQKSIELNDNRAVYRSSLLLDSDLAARSASLGRIYNDLGFQMLALAEGWKSVNADPANHSAHRFLADSYAGLPRHEIARVSDLLQSQLLQPLIIAPVQPQSAESNLFIVEGSGPAEPSFNEFNPLFLRDRLALQASGVVGENDTWGDEIVHNAVLGKFSYSLGQFHHETEGFRENNDQQKDIINAFAQTSLTHKTSLQAEVRHSSSERGDLELTFLDSFNPNFRSEEKANTFRIGGKHSFTPKSDLLASFVYQNADIDTTFEPGFFEITSDIDFFVGELSHLWKSKRFNTTAGAGYRDLGGTDEEVFIGFPMEEDIDSKHANGYLYTQILLPKQVNLTLGLSYDYLDNPIFGIDENQLNPKFGIIWNPMPSTTIRGAVFRTLQKPRVSRKNIDPTLEPTQVAGFNQFFFGSEGNAEWRYGLAIDQKLLSSAYAGLEISARDIDALLIDPTGPEPVTLNQDWEEKYGRAYLYWTPFDQIALSAEYFYEWFDRDSNGEETGVEEFTTLKTHRFPLGLRYFHPIGVSAGLKATYIRQDGDFISFDQSGLIEVPGDDQFWVVDAAIRYRLPKRYGTISLVAKNLFNEEFSFQDTDPGNPQIVPDRQVLLKATFSF